MAFTTVKVSKVLCYTRQEHLRHFSLFLGAPSILYGSIFKGAARKWRKCLKVLLLLMARPRRADQSAKLRFGCCAILRTRPTATRGGSFLWCARGATAAETPLSKLPSFLISRKKFHVRKSKLPPFYGGAFRGGRSRRHPIRDATLHSSLDESPRMIDELHRGRCRTFRTLAFRLSMSAFGDKADISKSLPCVCL